eukprot:6176762-Pleurochrysis_carterae.AAC.3
MPMGAISWWEWEGGQEGGRDHEVGAIEAGTQDEDAGYKYRSIGYLYPARWVDGRMEGYI